MIEINLKTVRVQVKLDWLGRQEFPVEQGAYTVEKILRIAPEVKDMTRMVSLRKENGSMLFSVPCYKLVEYINKNYIVFINEFS